MIEDDDDARPLEKEERRSPRRRKDGLDAWIWIAALLGGEKRERHTQARSKASLEKEKVYFSSPNFHESPFFLPQL
jgi:hypothetical protein